MNKSAAKKMKQRSAGKPDIELGKRIRLRRVEQKISQAELGDKLGQKVVVAVDAYPDDTFTGRVSRIGSATTARFALIPTPNPSGNFTKITQRVPVKIDIVDPPKPLTPGMMVEVEIDVR